MGEGAPLQSEIPPDEQTTAQVQLPEARGKRPARPPAVLVVGDGETLGDALLECMKHRGLVVAASPTDRAIASAVARAPDLVLLVGDAAREGGQRTIRMLATRPTTARLPVVVLEDAAGDALDRRLRALRAGALAIVDRSASADAMAGRVADLAIFVADHGKRTAAGIDVTLDELASVVRKELGQLLPDEDGAGGTVEAPGREMAEAIERFVASVRAMVRRSDPDGARLRGAPAVRVATEELGVADLAAFDDGATYALRGGRILVVVDDAGRGDSLATELRARGATVVLSGPREEGLARARELDPEVVLVDADALRPENLDVVGWLARDPRLRWSAVLVTSWGELAPNGATVPAMPAVAERVAPCRALERDLAARAHEEARLDVDIASLGPCRALRALASVPHVLSVTLLDDPGALAIDVANGLVAGAVQRDGAAGLAALAQFLALPACTLHVERRRAPQSANVLLPVEDALALAGRELRAATPSSLPIAHEPDEMEPVTMPGTRAAPPTRPLDFLDDGHDTATDVSPMQKPAAPARPPAILLSRLTPGSGVARPSLEPGALADALEPEGGTPAAGIRREAPAPRPPPLRVRPRTLMGVAPPHVARPEPPPVPPASAPEASHEPLEAFVSSGSVHPPPDAPVPPSDDGFPELPSLSALAATSGSGAPVAPVSTPPAGPPISAPPSARPVSAAETAFASAPGTFAAPSALGTGAPAPALGALPAHATRTQPRGTSALPILVGLLVVLGLLGGTAFAVWHFVLAPPTTTVAAIPLPAVIPTVAPPHPVADTHPVAPVAPPSVTPVGPGTTVIVAPTPMQTPTPHLAQPMIVAPTPTPTPPPLPVIVAPTPTPTPTPPTETPAALDAPLPEVEQSEALTEQARALLDHHDDAGAEPLLLQAAALGPRNPHPMEALARLYLARGDAPHAVEWADKLVGVRHRRASFRVLQGDARKLAGDQAAAEAAWRAALELEPDNHDAHARLGE